MITLLKNWAVISLGAFVLALAFVLLVAFAPAPGGWVNCPLGTTCVVGVR